jgi:type II secretory pathway pseudopilin PulG
MEIVIVMIVGIALATMAITAFAPAQQKLAVRSARQTLAAMHARTRAHAIEAGSNVVLNLNFSEDKAWITRDGTTLETVNFYETMHVDLRGAGATMEICMNARGFGESSCNSFNSGTDILFVQNSESKRMRVFPLGQVVMP